MEDRACKNPHCSSFGKPHPNCQCYGGYAYGGKIQHFCDRKDAHEKGCKYAKGGEVKSFSVHEENPSHYTLTHPNGDVLKIAKNGLSKQLHDHIKKMPRVNHFDKGGKIPQSTPTENITPTAADMQPPANDTPLPMPAPLQSDTPKEAAQGVAPQQAQRLPAPNPVGAQETKAPVNENAVNISKLKRTPQGESFVPPTPISQASQIKQMEGEISHGQTMQDQALQNRRNTLKAYNDEQIDFHDVWHDKGIANKVLASIGLIVAGAGAGLTGGANQAAEAMNNAIKLDVEKQKMKLGKIATLHDKYRELYSDEGLATKMHIDSLKTVAAAKMTEYALKNRQDMMKAMGNMTGNQQTEQFLNYLDMNDPDYGKNLRSRYIPDFGIASRPIEQKNVDNINKRVAFHKQMDELKQLAINLSGFSSINPANAAAVNYAKTKALSALNTFRNTEGLGVPRELTQEFEKSMIDPDPTKFLAFIRTIPKYQAVQDVNLLNLNQDLKSMGFNPYQPSQLTPRNAHAQRNSKPK